MADISKIKLPDGTTYNIKDTITEIGGRNLLLKTNQGKTNWSLNTGNGSGTVNTNEDGVRFTIITKATNWMCFQYLVDANLKALLSNAGGTFTLSMDIRSSVDFNVSQRWSVREANSQNPLIEMFSPAVNQLTADQWKHVEMVGTTTGNQTANNVYVYINMLFPVGNYDIKNLKLEKGSKATDWTPAPEDQITGSGTSGCIAKFNGVNTVTDGPAFGSSITNFLAENGQWRTPTDNKVRQNYIEDTIEKSYMLLLGEHDSTYSEYATTETAGARKALGLDYCIKDGTSRRLIISATNGSDTRSIELRPFGTTKIPMLGSGRIYNDNDIYSEGDIYSESNIGCDGTVTANSVTLPHKYSTNEQIVGYWIDDSPIYEKTIQLSSIITIASNSSTAISTSYWSQTAKPIDFKVYRMTQAGYQVGICTIAVIDANGKLTIYNTRQGSLAFDTFTIQYIKI